MVFLLVWKRYEQWGVVEQLVSKAPPSLTSLPHLHLLALIYDLDISACFYICPIFISLLQTDIKRRPRRTYGPGILRSCFQSWNGRHRAKPGRQLLHIHVLWLQGISFSVSATAQRFSCVWSVSVRSDWMCASFKIKRHQILGNVPVVEKSCLWMGKHASVLFLAMCRIQHYSM